MPAKSAHFADPNRSESGRSRGAAARVLLKQKSGTMAGVRAAQRLRLYSHEARAQREAQKRLTKSGHRQSRRSVVLDAARMFPRTGALPRSATAASLIARRIRGDKLTMRETLFLVLEEPASGSAATIVSYIVRLATLLATASSVLESIPSLIDSTGNEPWLLANAVFFSLFTLEACARVACYVPFEGVLADAFIWLDILTVVPFLVRLVVTAAAGGSLLDVPQSQRCACAHAQAHVHLHAYLHVHIHVHVDVHGDVPDVHAPGFCRVLEAFGSIRLLKLCRYDEGASLLFRAMTRSMAQLCAPAPPLVPPPAYPAGPAMPTCPR